MPFSKIVEYRLAFNILIDKYVSPVSYDDLKNPDNNCIFSTLKQLSDHCKIPYRTLQDKFSKSDIYYDSKGTFKLEKRIHYMAKSKIRNKK